MHEFPKEVLAAVGVVVAAVLGFFGVKIKNRRDDAAVARELRDELREENRLLKERVTALESLVQSLLLAQQDRRVEQAEWHRERFVLKRGLDKRDKEITQLSQEIADLRSRFDDFSEPL